MSADELGSIWSSEPVRVTQAAKPVRKEHDSEKKDHEDTAEPPEREPDSFELSSENEQDDGEQIEIHMHPSEGDELIPGSNFDVTIG